MYHPARNPAGVEKCKLGRIPADNGFSDHRNVTPVLQPLGTRGSGEPGMRRGDDASRCLSRQQLGKPGDGIQPNAGVEQQIRTPCSTLVQPDLSQTRSSGAKDLLGRAHGNDQGPRASSCQ